MKNNFSPESPSSSPKPHRIMMGNASELIIMKAGEDNMMAKTSKRIRLKGGEKPNSHEPSL